MSDNVLIANLEKTGWKAFAPGEFLGVDFDQIGKAKIARNNWFLLLKSIPLLDAAGLDTWNEHYAHFSKRSRAGMFSSGKYFILILLVDSVGKDALERFAEGNDIGFLQLPDDITRGGGYTLMIVKDRKQILTPKKVVLWDVLRATDFVKQTHQAVADYVNRL